MPTYTSFDAALDSISDAGPDLRNGLTNHAPMALEALCALGREDALVPWLDQCRPGLQPWPSECTPINPHDWRPALGHSDYVSDWRVFFMNKLRNTGWREVLNCWVERLAPAICASATHGVIRVAHAVRALSLAETPIRVAELAAGLGYWAACYQELPTALPTSQPTERPSVAIKRVPIVPQEQRRFTGTIVASLERLDEFPTFAPVIGFASFLGEASDLVSELTETFARVYLANAHDVLTTIVFIHGVTSGASLRLLAPHLSEPVLRDALRYTWQAQCGIYAAFGQSSAPAQAIATPHESHDELIDMAVTNGDEHVIKFTEACLREHTFNPKPVYLAAARHAMRVLKG